MLEITVYMIPRRCGVYGWRRLSLVCWSFWRRYKNLRIKNQTFWDWKYFDETSMRTWMCHNRSEGKRLWGKS